MSKRKRSTCSPACSTKAAEGKKKAAGYYRARRQRVRRRAIVVLGGECSLCGVQEHRVLQFDHVSGDGSSHRRRNGDGRDRGIEFFRDIIFGRVEPDSIQLLCANCHVLKTYENGDHCA